MSYKLNDNVEVYTAEEADERFSAGNVAVEKERAETAEAALDTKIDNEITRATGAEGTNASNIAQNTSDIASLSSTVSGFSTDIAANTSAITTEVTRATTAEGQLSTSIINETARASSIEEVNRKHQAFIFDIEADKPSVNYDATTKIKISDGQLVFVKDTKKWYTATTTSTQGASVTWTEFEMPGGGGDVTQAELDTAVAEINATINTTAAELRDEIADAEYAAERTATLLATGEPPVTSIPATYKNVTTSGAFPGTEFPYLYTHDVTDFSQMFSDSTGLTSVTDLDTRNGTIFYSMFARCSSLTSAPALDTSKGTNFSNMFQQCTLLASIPNLVTSNGTNFSRIFTGCTSLTSIPNLDTSNGTNFTYMFNGCSALTSIPDLNIVSNTSGFTDMFAGCTSLTTLRDNPYATEGHRWQFDINISFGDCPLDRASIIKVFKGLVTVSGKTITISSTTNGYLSAADKAIAENKGWTVSVQ